MAQNDNTDLLFCLGKTADWHAAQVFENGISYLERYFESTPELITLYSYHSAYWKWWANQYERRNKMLLLYIRRSAISQEQALQRYNKIHHVSPREVFPARVVEQLILKQKQAA